MKEGWTLAICEYHKITIFLKHQSLSNTFSEALICPIFHQQAYPPYLENLILKGNFPNPSDFSSIKPNSIRDFSCHDLPSSRLIISMLPASPSDDQLVKLVKTSLEICNSLGCGTVSIPIPVLENPEKSADLILEGVENYILGQMNSPGCVKEINICCQTLQELQGVNEVSKFRMTRYSSYMSLGFPEDLPLTHMYCYICFSIYPADSNHEGSHI